MKVTWSELQYQTDRHVQHDGPGEFVVLQTVLPGQSERARRPRRPAKKWSSLLKPLRWLQQKLRHVMSLAEKILEAHDEVPYLIEELEDVRLEIHQCELELSEGENQLRVTIIHHCLMILHGDAEESLSTMSVLHEQVNEMMKRANDIESRGVTQKWKMWLHENLSGGAKAVHRWTRVPANPRRSNGAWTNTT